jgi:hypothetical protein
VSNRAEPGFGPSHVLPRLGADLGAGLRLASSDIWKNKGGSPGAGFVLGALLGFIGLIIVAIAMPAGTQRSSANPTRPSIVWVRSGTRYLFGYTIESPFYGIWDREAPGPPIERFPYNRTGKLRVARYSDLEPHSEPLGGQSVVPPSPPPRLDSDDRTTET